jgi:hypothetical protein
MRLGMTTEAFGKNDGQTFMRSGLGGGDHESEGASGTPKQGHGRTATASPADSRASCWLAVPVGATNTTNMVVGIHPWGSSEIECKQRGVPDTHLKRHEGENRVSGVSMHGHGGHSGVYKEVQDNVEASEPTRLATKLDDSVAHGPLEDPIIHQPFVRRRMIQCAMQNHMQHERRRRDRRGLAVREPDQALCNRL